MKLHLRLAWSIPVISTANYSPFVESLSLNQVHAVSRVCAARIAMIVHMYHQSRTVVVTMSVSKWLFNLIPPLKAN